MKVDFIKLYCSECGKYRTLPAEAVKVTFDMEVNTYDYRATCYECGKEIHNARRNGK
jgi:hypothetical protein